MFQQRQMFKCDCNFCFFFCVQIFVYKYDNDFFLFVCKFFQAVLRRLKKRFYRLFLKLIREFFSQRGGSILIPAHERVALKFMNIIIITQKIQSKRQKYPIETRSVECGAKGSFRLNLRFSRSSNRIICKCLLYCLNWRSKSFQRY